MTVLIVFTGGTITMRHDPATGGAVPALAAGEILAAARGIDRVADIEVDEWGRFPGPHMTVERIWALRNHLVAAVARRDVQGVVVAHGTDTMEETAYLVARSVASPTPIVFTGAMRAASDLGWDGPANLLDAARVAASPEAWGYGAMVAMNGRVFAGLDVTKAHTHLLDAFASPGLGPIGVVDDGAVVFRRALPTVPPPLDPPALATPVDIVAAYTGADRRLLDAARAGARGLVLAALGRGNVPPEMADGVAAWIADGKPAVVTSRSQRGRVGTTYAYTGGGRRLADAGALFAGSRRPQQARIDLMLALGAGLTGDALREVFAG